MTLLTVESSSEMEYCMSAVSILAEEFWQIVEYFVEFPANVQAKSMICERNLQSEDLSFVQQGGYWIFTDIAFVKEFCFVEEMPKCLCSVELLNVEST